MKTTTVRVKVETRDKLAKIAGRGRSIDAVIVEMLKARKARKTGATQ